MIRKAMIKDVKAIHILLQEFSSKGELLARPLSELYDHIRDFSVYAEEGSDTITGCCALQFCWEDLAEIRSLAVTSSRWGEKDWFPPGGERDFRSKIVQSQRFVYPDLPARFF